MTAKVGQSPSLPAPNKDAIASISALNKALFKALSDIAYRLNLSVTTDGGERMTKPERLAQYLKADLPTASDWDGGLVAVTNEAGGYTLAFSDGTNWRRVQDRAIVS